MVDPMTSPRFSIIIPAFNEENTIATCIQAIEDNDYPVAQYDITVADNGSVDNTAAIAGSQGVKVLECGRAKGIGVAAMRNQGAAVTRGDILIFIDADVEIPKNFLKTAEQYFDSEFEGVLGFVDRPPPDAGWVGRVWNGVPTLKRPQAMSVDNLPGRNLLVNRTVFESLNGFDETLPAGEDKDFCLRAVRAGFNVVSLPTPNPIHLNYDANLGTLILKEFWRQGSTLEIARNQGYSLRSLRNPLLSMWHLAGGVLFGFTLLLSSIDGWILPALFLWFLPATLIAVKTVGNRRSGGFLLQYLFLTFLRWNTAGAALIHQMLKRIVPNRSVRHKLVGK